MIQPPILTTIVLLVCLGIILVLYKKLRDAKTAIGEKNEFIENYLSPYTEGLHQQEQFLSQINHDINGPLHNILVVTELLKTQDTSPETAQQYDLIYQSAQRLHIEFKEVLKVGPPWQNPLGAVGETAVAIDLEQWLKTWVSDFRTSKPTIRTQFSFGESPESAVVMQPLHVIERLLEPILLNSTRGANVKIQFKDDDYKWLTLSISDDGPGIPNAILPYVCYPFVKYPVNNQGQLGLGLYQAARSAQLLSAKLKVQNLTPSGIRVNVVIPR